MKTDRPPVVKLAQPGYDVKTAGDENLIYNSNWPVLKIYQSGPFQTRNIAVQQSIADHDLGFTPVFWYFANTPINLWANTGTASQEARSEFMGPLGDGVLEIDSKSLTYVPNSAFPGVTGPAALYYYLFALDIAKQYTAPIIKLGDIQGARGSRVFKIAKPGKDITSDDLFDFILHSRARSPMVHSVNPTPGTVKSFTVDHNLTYLPMFFAFEKTARGSYKTLYTGQGGSSSIQSSETQVIFNDSGGKEITIVVLKDPFSAAITIGVDV